MSTAGYRRASPDRSDLARVPRRGFDLYLHIDDGLPYRLPAALRPCAWRAIDTHLDFAACLDKVRGFELRRLVAPGGEQSPGHLLRIAPVHLAAQRPQEEARQCLGLGQVLLESSIDERRSRCRRGGLADPWVRQIEDRQPPSAGSVDHWA